VSDHGADRPYDLVVLAELNPDVVVSCTGPVQFGQVEQLVDRASLTLGSSGAITAAAAASLGLRVALCAVVGDDELAETTVALLSATGVDVSGVVRRPGRHTGMTVVLSRPDGDRALLTFPGTMTELSAADIALDRLAAARHVHVSSYFLQTALQKDLPTILGHARAHGTTTSIDPGWDPADSWSALLPVLAHVDVLLPNAAECDRIARALGCDGSVTDAAQAVQACGPTVVVKLGAQGAIAATTDSVVQVAAHAIAPVDTTGAGDNFDAGYLSALIAGRPIAEALARGVACGSLSVQGWGGTGALATAAQAEELAATLTAFTPLSDSRVEERP
jgi:ribokinase